jgi:hypothetical protein
MREDSSNPWSAPDLSAVKPKRRRRAMSIAPGMFRRAPIRIRMLRLLPTAFCLLPPAFASCPLPSDRGCGKTFIIEERPTSEGDGMAITNSLAGRNLGMILLGLWLILTGLLPLLNVRLSPAVTMGLAVLAIVAGILILLRR